MKKLGLATLVGSLALISSSLAAEIDLISNLKISGDARLRAISTSGITASNSNANEVYDSRIRLNLDTTTEDGIKLHTRILFDNNNWGNNNINTANDDDGFTWDEASVFIPYNDFFLYAGRINDTYGTKFYGSNGDKLDLAFVGYTGIKNTLLYGFDYKVVESNSNNNNGGFFSTGDGDVDAYSVGAQMTIDKLLIGGRYALIEAAPNTEYSFVDAFVLGEVAGIELEAQVEKNFNDSDAFGAYLNIGKQFTNLRVGLVALVTKDGYTSGQDLEASYLTNDDSGINSLGREGAYGDTTTFAGQIKYNVSPKLSLEGIVALHSIENSTLGGINVDQDIVEYNLGLSYQFKKSASLNIRYAGANLDNNALEDVQNFMAGIQIKF